MATPRDTYICIYTCLLGDNDFGTHDFRGSRVSIASACEVSQSLAWQANALTDALKPLSNLKLELSSIAPVMLYGYGAAGRFLTSGFTPFQGHMETHGHRHL